MAKVVNLPVPAPQTADEHARAETQRNQQLFAWADGVLKLLGLDKAVTAAKTIEKLRSITLDVETPEVLLAIREALHPVSGNRAAPFRGLREGGLKQILKNRFAELKKTREAKLRRGKQPGWEDGLILDKEGRIKPNIANLILILRQSPDWAGVLGYDEFAARVIIRKRPPLEAVTANVPWTDHHESLTRVWFLQNGVSPAMGDTGRAVQAAARHNSFHPTRDYLESLVWNGTPRSQSWLQTYLHAKDSEYIRAIGPRVLISAVARIYKPGCQCDNMAILEGPQGKLKSTALRILAVRDEWFADRLSHVDTKDASIETAGIWIFEISEMEGLLKAAPSAQKRFISSRSDRYLPPYGKHTISRPRQNIFAGTINPPADGCYLQDPTGARRYWPLTCIGMIDVAGLEQIRDQLWAEAVYLFKAGRPWHLETPELEALATVEQDKRFVVDPWEKPIREWLGDRTDITIWDVLEHALGLNRKQQQAQPTQKRVVSILTRLRFTQRHPRTPGGGREWRYQRDPPLKKDD